MALFPISILAGAVGAVILGIAIAFVKIASKVGDKAIDAIAESTRKPERGLDEEKCVAKAVKRGIPEKEARRAVRRAMRP